MEKVKSCGFVIYREKPQRSILLMKHPKRWDLPKGHVDEGETNMQCALRELHEETGIEETHLNIVEGFKFKDRYIVENKSGKKKKTLIIYLAELIAEVEIVPTEHEGYQWIDWNPPHTIQEKTIDPLLANLASWWSSDAAKESAADVQVTTDANRS